MKALVLGATGCQGRRTVAELARSGAAERLLLTGRHEGRLRELATRLGDRPEITTAVVDATNARQIADACDGMDILISCAGPAHTTELPCIEAAILAQVPGITLGDDLGATEDSGRLRPAAERAGVTIVEGCGLSPGVTNILAMYAAAAIEEVEEIKIGTAYSLRDYLGPVAVTSLIRSFSLSAAYISDWRELSGRAGDLPDLMYFPEPLSWVETFTCSHPEVLTLQRRFPQVRNLRYRLGLTERAGMDLIRGPAALRLTDASLAGKALGRLVSAVQPALSAMPPRGAPWTGARVDVRGQIEGRSSTISLGIADRLPNLTSASLVFAALEITGGRAQRPGVWAPEEVFSATTFLKFLNRRGIRIARLTPELFEKAGKV